MQNAAAIIEHWSNAHRAGRAAEAALASSPPPDGSRAAELEEGMTEALESCYEIERRLAEDRTPGVPVAIGKLRIALAYAERAGHLAAKDLSWLLVASALASLEAGGIEIGAALLGAWM